MPLECRWGHHECARALIDAGAAVDQADNVLETALMEAIESPSLDEISDEESDADVDSDGYSDTDEEA